MKINIITIFPDFFKASVSYSILKRAQDKGIVDFHIYDLREWSDDNYRTIDDRPYGGGAGMVMMVEPVYKALRALQATQNVIVPSAKGRMWNQALASKFALFEEMTFVVPHFEGIDERVLENLVNYEISVGPYVLSGGELPTMSIIDTVVRLIPGVLGNAESLTQESYNDFNASGQENQSSYTLEYPQYTRPAIFTTETGEQWSVPEVLLSGNHKEIEQWRESKRQKIKS